MESESLKRLLLLPKSGSLFADDKQKFGDRVMEEKERIALFLCQARRECVRLAPQLYPTPWEIGKGVTV